MSQRAVLILSSDPLAAALLGAAVELAGYDANFARENERARSALLRVRPRLVLIDCDNEDACSDAFVGPALMTNAHVLLFRSRHSTRDVSELIAHTQVSTIELPLEGDRLNDVFKQLLG